MARSLTQKLIDSHLVAGKPVAGHEIGISVDQVYLAKHRITELLKEEVGRLEKEMT